VRIVDMDRLVADEDDRETLLKIIEDAKQCFTNVIRARPNQAPDDVDESAVEACEHLEQIEEWVRLHSWMTKGTATRIESAAATAAMHARIAADRVRHA